MSEELLFSGHPLFAVVQALSDALKKKIQSIPAATILNASEQDVIDSIVQEFRMNVPIIKDQDIYIADSGETQVDVSRDPGRRFIFGDESRGPAYIPGTKTVIAIPFNGDADLFRVQPQWRMLNGLRAGITQGELHLTYVRTDQDGAAIKREYETAVASIKQHLSSLSQSAAQFNNQLPQDVATQIKARKNRLLADAGMTASIGLPLKKREGVSATYSVPVVRRTPRIEQHTVGAAFQPEPELAHEDYEEILRIIQSMVRVMELSPHAFQGMGEEDLRSHFLVQLNGAYQGQATGETFNFQGKTDILIRVQDKNVFIAECKFWKGEKAFLATLDQLLSYLSWRDTKTAVLIFNRNADFSAVLAKIREMSPTHPHFKRDLGPTGETAFRYVFSQPSDKSREIILTVVAFDIPAPSVKQPEQSEEKSAK